MNRSETHRSSHIKPPILQSETHMNKSDHQSKSMAVTPSAREENVYMVKLAEQAQQYEEMVEFTEKVSKAVESEELTFKERNPLFVVYKNVIVTRRASWHIISWMEQKEESRGNEDHMFKIRDYRSKIEPELSNICDGILKLLDIRLIPSAATSDSNVFYLKMKGEWAPAMDSGEWEILSIEREKSERIWD